MSAWDIGIGRSLSWGEACDLLDAALDDSTTPLFAAVAGWDWPASMPEILSIVGTFGKEAHKVLPFNEDAPTVSDAEVAAAHESLQQHIRFTN